jgi:natural product precursor
LRNINIDWKEIIKKNNQIMKKLESLDNEKFRISEDELNHIKGGYGSGGGSGTSHADNSYNYYYTGSGGLDQQLTDVCITYD